MSIFLIGLSWNIFKRTIRKKKEEQANEINEFIYYKDGNLKYKGDVVNGEPHGSGMGYWDDGETVWYEGEFREGKPKGKGKYYYRSGQLRYEGYCDDDLQYIGQGTEYYENGNIKFTGTYKKSFHFFYGARCYVAGKLYDQDGKLRYEGTFSGSKNYEFKEGMEYLGDGSTKVH